MSRLSNETRRAVLDWLAAERELSAMCDAIDAGDDDAPTYSDLDEWANDHRNDAADLLESVLVELGLDRCPRCAGQATIEVYHDQGDEVCASCWQAGPWWVNVYEASRDYGGPEEGGWWYEVGYPHEWKRADSRVEAIELRDQLVEMYPRTGKRSSVLGGEDWEVRIERNVAQPYPEHRPRYE